MAETQTYQPPSCEDYDSDQSNGHVLEFRPQANVTAKRSHPEDLAAVKPPALDRVSPTVDVRSDSGYSSYTAATMSSADSAPSATVSRSPPVQPPSASSVPTQSPPPKTRRPTVGDPRQHNAQPGQSSPRPKPPSRTTSQSSKRPSVSRRPTITQERRDARSAAAAPGDCGDPNCTGCAPAVAPLQRRRTDRPPSDSARQVPYTAADQRPVRPDAATYYASPPSPVRTRQPAPYVQGAVVTQPAQSRRRSSSSARQRPMSYHGNEPYYAQGVAGSYGSQPSDRGPPPSMSAYHNMPSYTSMAPQMPSYLISQSQSNDYYSPVQSTPTIRERPAISARNSGYAPRNYPAPVVTQERMNQSMYSARYGQPPSATQPTFPQHPFEDDGSDSQSETDDHYEPEPQNLRAIMPPPMAPPIIKQPKPSKRRPSLVHAATTQVVDRIDRRMSQSVALPERPAPPKDRDRVSRSNIASKRGTSLSRPPLVTQRQTQSAYETPRTRTIVENSKSNRRKSYQVSSFDDEYARARALEEQYRAEQKRQNRNSRVYVENRYEAEQNEVEQDDEEEEEPRLPLAIRSRRRTETDSRKGKERIVESKPRRAENEAEAYMKATRGSRDPYADQIHKAAKKGSRVPSASPSDSDSSGSQGSGKASQSNRTTMTSTNGNEIRLRVDASHPLSLSFNGDMEGRTLQLVPAGDGMADIVIGNSRGGESQYRSEKGSVLGGHRKAIITSQARRDAEEISERSSRSGRSGRSRREDRDHQIIREDRERQRRVLGRRRDIDYH